LRWLATDVSATPLHLTAIESKQAGTPQRKYSP